MEEILQYDLDLEEEIGQKIESILSGGAGFARTIVRSGRLKKAPVGILSAKGIPASPRWLLTDNQAAHLLSLFAEEETAGFHRAVRNIILYPAFIENRDHLLTHLYSPVQETLVFYMYPARLHTAREIRPVGRFAEQTFQRPGLLDSVARAVIEIHRSHTSGSRLHKFLLPKLSVQEGEIREMRETSSVCESLMLPIVPL